MSGENSDQRQPGAAPAGDQASPQDGNQTHDSQGGSELPGHAPQTVEALRKENASWRRKVRGLEEQIAEFSKAKKEREEKKLREAENYEELLKGKESDLQSLQSQLEAQRKQHEQQLISVLVDGAVGQFTSDQEKRALLSPGIREALISEIGDDGDFELDKLQKVAAKQAAKAAQTFNLATPEERAEDQKKSQIDRRKKQTTPGPGKPRSDAPSDDEPLSFNQKLRAAVDSSIGHKYDRK